MKTIIILLLTICLFASCRGPKVVSKSKINAINNFQIFMLAGQSNMAGRGHIDSLSEVYYSSRVFMLDSNFQVVEARHPLHFDKSYAQVGPGLKFGSEMVKADTSSKILLVPCAVGGTSIEKWMPGAYDSITNTHPYDDAIKRLSVAIQYGEFRGVLWHQGEAGRSDEKYLDKLVELIKRIRSFAGDDDLPFVAGELGYFLERTEIFNKNLQKLPDRLENVSVVCAQGLTHKGDEVHFDARSAEILGDRYAKAMKDLLTE